MFLAKDLKSLPSKELVFQGLCLGTWFTGRIGSAGLTVELNDLKDLCQSEQFCESMILFHTASQQIAVRYQRGALGTAKRKGERPKACVATPESAALEEMIQEDTVCMHTALGTYAGFDQTPLSSGRCSISVTAWCLRALQWCPAHWER